MAVGIQGQRLEETDYKILIVSLALLVLSMVGLGASSHLVPFWSSVVASISSVLLSIALLSLVYEWLLRKAVTVQLLSLVGIERSLSAAGLRDLTDELELNWSDFLVGGARFQILLIDPTVWVTREWRRVLDEARERTVEVCLLLPNPDGALLRNLSERLHVSPEALRERLRSSQRTIEETWKQQALSEEIVPGSELKIIHYEEFPCYELVRCNEKTVLILGASVKSREGRSGIAAVFRGSNSSYPSQLFVEEIATLQEGAAVYYNRVEPK